MGLYESIRRARLRSRRAACTVALLCGLLGGALSGDAQALAPSSDPRLAAVEKFLAIAYPEMWSKATRITVTTDIWGKGVPWRAGWYGVDVEKTSAPLAGTEGGVEFSTTPCAQAYAPPVSILRGCEIPFSVTGHPLWHGIFWLVSTGTRVGLSLNGTLVSVERKNLDLKRLVDSHPDWNDTQIAEALKKAGARYGPDREQALESHVSLKRYATYLGAVKVDSVRFLFRRGSAPAGHPPRATLAWRIEVKGPLSDWKAVPGYRRRRACQLSFEPFDGSLVGLGCSQEIIPSPERKK